MCYIVPRWKTSTIILWDRVLKTEYLHIANVQEYDGKIVYVWWNDWNNKVIVVVDRDGTIKTYNIGTSTPKMFDEDTSLLPFAEIN